MSKPRLAYAVRDNWQLVNIPLGKSLVGGGRVSADIAFDCGDGTNPNLSISWEYTDPGCRQASAFGQIGDELVQFAPDTVAHRLREIWREWHLNDMHAGCEHQRALGWEREGYDKHPSEPCPTCGYRYGTEWLRVEIPADVLEWLAWFRTEVEKAL